MYSTVHVETGEINKVLFNFAAPVMVSQLFQELYSITDCAILGRFGGDQAIASISVASVILSLYINFFIGFSSGISVVTSTLFGRYDYSSLKKTVNTIFRLCLTAGILICIVNIILAEDLFTALNCPKEVKTEALEYIRISSLSIAAQLIYNTAMAVLRSLGDCKSPLRCFAESCLLNILLDVLFVVILKQGLRGAAIGTLISQWFLALLMIKRLRTLEPEYRLSFLGQGLSWEKLFKMLYMGVPAGMQAFFMSMSSLIIQKSINGFGPEAMAGMNLYAKLEGLLYLPTFAYGIALTGFIGQNAGAGRMDRVQESVGISVRLMIRIILPMSLLITFVSPLALRIFTDNPGILKNAQEAIFFNLPVYVFYGINQVYLGAIKGLGKTLYPMVCTLVCYSIFRVVWCDVLLVHFSSMKVVYLSYDVSFMLMLFMLLPVYKRLIRQEGGCK